jgi:hypothetical protein
VESKRRDCKRLSVEKKKVSSGEQFRGSVRLSGWGS